MNQAPADRKQGRDPLHEAQSALHFWQALEYLAPQSPPDVNPADYVWQLDAGMPDECMPWRDPRKQTILKKLHPHWRFQIFSGIADGPALIEQARSALGAEALALEERRPPAPAACVVIEVDGSGMASGAVFISTVPWAMAQIVKHAGTTSPITFQGFFGVDGVDETIERKVTNLLVERRLLRAAQAGDDAQPCLPDDTLRAITTADIDAVERLVFDECGWHPQQQMPRRIKAVMASASGEKKAADDPLNSFYAEDLERVSGALAGGDSGAGLRAYLQGEDAPGRVDLERDTATLIAGVHPRHLPPGAWPAAHPLVTAQQFAVNIIMRELADSSGIFSVNGPPGTGKTTMLKDIVAATIVSRADVMATYSRPASAFGSELVIDGYLYRAHELDQNLCGYGIVVASANNGAVENISKELPGLKALAEEIELDYFSIVADSVAAPEKSTQRTTSRQHWGLIAAALGNKENRGNFAGRFWFADPVRKKKSGKENDAETPAPPPPDPLRLRSLQSLIDSGEHGALPWHEARARYQAARAAVDVLVEQAGTLAEAVATLDASRQTRLSCAQALARLEPSGPLLEAAATAAASAAHAADHDLLVARERSEVCQALARYLEHAASAAADVALWQSRLPDQDSGTLRAAQIQAGQHCEELDQQYDQHVKRRPGLLSQICRTKFSERWNRAGQLLEQEIAQARTARQAAASALTIAESVSGHLSNARRAQEAVLAELTSVEQHARAIGVGAAASTAALENDVRKLEAQAAICRGSGTQAQRALKRHAREIAQYRRDLALADDEMVRIDAAIATYGLDPKALATWSLERLARDELHRAAPYFMPGLFHARRELFAAAIELHKSFIVASWPKLRPTLSAFVNLLTGGISAAQVEKGPMALWDAFHLVVPLVSTTFASFPRLFAGVGREQLAWLLIDEAGQATPQQAVGAIWRAQRTVIVGDPLQLEPVVGVPAELVTPLLARCAAEKQWAPPAASAQVLADRANRHGTYLGEGEQRVWLGAPLVVHRRCLDPMFSIANTISYDGLMVHGTDEQDLLHWPSCWIDCPAQEAEGHWVQAQGDIAIKLVASIMQGQTMSADQRKVYIITPFRKVAEKIREMLVQTYGKHSAKMSGTVHTFQGKEADNVIFLLGGDPKRPGVISSFAGARPNLVNVAVTRARRRLYVVGDRRYWTGAHDVHGIFGSMAAQLPPHRASSQADAAQQA